VIPSVTTLGDTKVSDATERTCCGPSDTRKHGANEETRQWLRYKLLLYVFKILKNNDQVTTGKTAF